MFMNDLTLGGLRDGAFLCMTKVRGLEKSDFHRLENLLFYEEPLMNISSGIICQISPDFPKQQILFIHTCESL